MKAMARPIPSLLTLSSLLQIPLSKPSNLLQIHHSSSSPSSLTPSELTQINLLIPRLCKSNNLPLAIHLLDTTFLIYPNPPNLSSLSLPILIDRLTASPDLTQPMSLLTRLTRNANAKPHILPIAQLLAASYFKKKRAKEALKIFNWLLRPNSAVVIDESTYRVIVFGFCRCGWTLEALKAVRGMVGVGIVIGEDLRKWVFRSLLREARVREAMEIDAALDCDGEGEGGFGRVVELIDRIVGDWRD